MNHQTRRRRRNGGCEDAAGTDEAPGSAVGGGFVVIFVLMGHAPGTLVRGAYTAVPLMFVRQRAFTWRPLMDASLCKKDTRPTARANFRESEICNRM
jgi:hypothetical protein